MGQATLIVLFTLFATGALLKAWTVWVRRRGLARLGEAPRLLALAGVPVRAYVEGGRWRGFAPRKAHRMTADMAITAERFVVSSGKGVLVDRRAGEAQGLRARSTGPGRLVLEGDAPGQRTPVLFRLELVVADAGAWAAALAPFAENSGPTIS